jgi:hypothetical protein
MSPKLLPILFSVLLLAAACADSNMTSPEKLINLKRRPSLAKVKEGDIVVKLGRGYLSRTIANKLAEKVALSHCGFVYRQGDSLCILHSVAKELTGKDGVQTVYLDEFLADCVDGYFYVVRIKDSTAQKHIPSIATNYFNKKAPFDYTINYSDSTKVNCSEFVYQVLKRAGSPNCFSTIAVENKKVLAFNSLIDSTNFTIIYHY